MIEYPVLVLHNVVSSSSCIEFVKISAGMGFKTVAITQAQGSAAQRGLPAAQKIAMQNNINFFSLNNLDDIKELLKPDLMILVAPPPYGKKILIMILLKHSKIKDGSQYLEVMILVLVAKT